ncbi:hypothetical protein [Lentzea sp. NBRC 102530]|uniref:terpene synthase family protein n=1 Tax=Lentzea sp. NBRC 102530 TaxID=3032201 RepID=UPI0024A40785|nr:hypothetical protein [Lentzea sp. NBRC 102530]GLY46866.1 hypothetical protein Lesp01_05220 [Lentzea sp. NBRC 102530]
MTLLSHRTTELVLSPPPGHPLLDLRPEISPLRDVIEQSILDWADEFDLLDGEQARRKLARTHLGELVARAYPRIEPDRVRAIAGWFTWAFVIDDCYDRPVGGHADAVTRLLHVLTPDGTEATTVRTRLDGALARVWSELARDRSPLWRMRFTQHMVQFVAAFKYEALNRGHRHTPSLVSYTQLRRASGGITPSLDLLEAATGQEVPALLHESEQLRTMFDRASDVVVWVNDIVSLPKELRNGETTNGVLVLAQARGLDPQSAVTAAYDLVARQMEEFAAAEQDLDLLVRGWLGLDRAELDALSSFVAGMKSWMRANLDWSNGCARYLVADGVHLATDPGLVAPLPGATAHREQP